MSCERVELGLITTPLGKSGGLTLSGLFTQVYSYIEMIRRTTISRQEKCISGKLMQYDMSCTEEYVKTRTAVLPN